MLGACTSRFVPRAVRAVLACAAILVACSHGESLPSSRCDAGGDACTPPPPDACPGAGGDACVPSQCAAGADGGASCDDGDPCTSGDACRGGQCRGTLCATPPKGACLDAETARVYETPGACTDGTCEYTDAEEFCRFGCDQDAGACHVGAVQISAGGFVVNEEPEEAQHTCAVLSDGTVRCWGANSHGQLGDGTTERRATPVTVVGLADVVQVAAGGAHTCAVVSDGTVSCWGFNAQAQLGFEGSDSPVPLQVPGVEGTVQVSATSHLSCARTPGGDLWCWGGWVPPGEIRTEPVLYDDFSAISDSPMVDLSVGWDHFCYAFASGEAYCDGDDGWCQSSPASSLSDVAQIDARYWMRTCAILADGTASCWGHCGMTGSGLCAEGQWITCEPLPVAGLSDVVGISQGQDHTCAVLADGTAWCWGANWVGQLGIDDRDVTGSVEPLQVVGLENVVQVSGGTQHTCAVVADGSAWCWGNNVFGQLGTGKGNARAPERVMGL